MFDDNNQRMAAMTIASMIFRRSGAVAAAALWTSLVFASFACAEPDLDDDFLRKDHPFYAEFVQKSAETPWSTEETGRKHRTFMLGAQTEIRQHIHDGKIITSFKEKSNINTNCLAGIFLEMHAGLLACDADLQTGKFKTMFDMSEIVVSFYVKYTIEKDAPEQITDAIQNKIQKISALKISDPEKFANICSQKNTDRIVDLVEKMMRNDVINEVEKFTAVPRIPEPNRTCL